VIAASARALLIALASAAAGCQSSDANARTPESTTAATARASGQKTPPKDRTVECRISRIADGDSVVCGSAGRIRLLMIDAPELAQGQAGRDAQNALADLMPVGTHVTVETDVRPRDTYNRILGYVYLDDGRMVNEEMARSGYATALIYPPNVKHIERIRRAVDEAKDAKRGLWATQFFDCSPRDYRSGKCGSRPPDSRQRDRRYPGRR